MLSSNPGVMSNFLAPQTLFSCLWSQKRGGGKSSTLTSYVSYAGRKSPRFSASLHLEDEGLGSLEQSLTTFTFGGMCTRNIHCETDLKHIREQFSQIFETTSASNQLVSRKPFISPELPWFDRGGGRRSQEACTPCKLRRLFLKWPHLCGLMTQRHHQFMIPSSV